MGTKQVDTDITTKTSLPGDSYIENVADIEYNSDKHKTIGMSTKASQGRGYALASRLRYIRVSRVSKHRTIDNTYLVIAMQCSTSFQAGNGV